ncbi:GroES-like protein [Exidia glandulosa HHB12029]|uniref:GroES-like protein n=1 Tax=Exidia glandulosa HHB12029 TaxID=1314781 RepID=A0A165BI21_EXIGL|nr:GroES-like protein [Exidia glandulosa HHB12029]
MSLPQTMRAVLYNAAEQLSVKEINVPTVGDDDVLMKVNFCGICGTDAHIHRGGFNVKFPIVPGHEPVGTVAAVGEKVKDFKIGDRIVADCSVVCEDCFFCRRGKPLYCTTFGAVGIQFNGGFAEYLTFPQRKVYKIHNLADEDATLLESAACAVHGLDQLKPDVGIEVLVLGSGPTGLILAQLLKLNGASKVAIASNKGVKLETARKLEAADVYYEIDRKAPDEAWQRLAAENPMGFDVVVNPSGAEKLANVALNYVRRGGTLMLYGVYDETAMVHWPPARIFREEIKIIASFSQTLCFPRAVAYLDSGKVKVKGMVSDVYTLEQYQEALDKMETRDAVKIVIKT